MSDTRGKDRRQASQQHETKEEKREKKVWKPKKEFSLGKQLALERSASLGANDGRMEKVEMELKRLSQCLQAKETHSHLDCRYFEPPKTVIVNSVGQISWLDSVRHYLRERIREKLPEVAVLQEMLLATGATMVSQVPQTRIEDRSERVENVLSSSSSVLTECKIPSMTSKGCNESVDRTIAEEGGVRRPFGTARKVWTLKGEIDTHVDERAFSKAVCSESVRNKTLEYEEVVETPVVEARQGVKMLLDIFVGHVYRMDVIKQKRVVSLQLAQEAMDHFGTGEMSESVAVAIAKYCQENTYVEIPVGLYTCRTDTAAFIVAWLESRLQAGGDLPDVQERRGTVVVSQSLNSGRSLYTCVGPVTKESISGVIPVNGLASQVYAKLTRH